MKKITLLLMILAVTIGYSQSPTTAPPTAPARDAADVVSIFSDAYTDVTLSELPTGWSQLATFDPAFDAGGVNVWEITGNEFIGMVTNYTTGENLSTMEKMHIDYWTPDSQNIDVKIVNTIDGGESFQSLGTTVTGSWQSVDLDMTGFTVNQTQITQILIDPASPNAMYIANFYFWKTATAAGTDATLSDLQVDASTISGFSAAILDYDFPLASGTTVIPQITTATPTDANVTSVTTAQATTIPGDATVEVVSQNGSVTQTYTVSFFIAGPATAATTPIARNDWDVISLFSNAYTDITVSEWSTTWDSASIEDVLVDGNDTKKITYGDFLGVDFSANSFSATDMERFHIDYYVDEALDAGEVFIPKWSNHTGGTGETNAFLYTEIVTASGTWVSIDIAISDMTAQATPPATDATATDNFSQLILGTGATINTLYVDNIYLYRAPTTLSTDDFETTDFSVYPNPSNDAWNVKTSNAIMNSIQVFDVLGKQVISLNPNSVEAKIDASTLPTGLYFAKIATDSGINSIKLIKN